MGGRRFLVGLVVATSLAANVAWSPSPIGVDFRTGIWSREPRPRHAALNEALQQLPDHASVSATYYVVPHVTHRKVVYEFPNPFRAANWGVKGDDLDPPENVEYLLVDTTTLGESRDVFEELIAEDYTVELSGDEIVLARRRPG
jgi:hypothetical protein